MNLVLPVSAVSKGKKISPDLTFSEPPLYNINCDVELLDGSVETLECSIWLNVKRWEYESGFMRPGDFEVTRVVVYDMEFVGNDVKAVEGPVEDWILNDDSAWFESRKPTEATTRKPRR